MNHASVPISAPAVLRSAHSVSRGRATPVRGCARVNDSGAWHIWRLRAVEYAWRPSGPRAQALLYSFRRNYHSF